ncbi:MAG: hypothetical protein ACLQVL_23190 [Terriglobia bacterium]
MPNTFEAYCQRLRAEAENLALEAEMPARIDHLHAFNFGRSVARMEHAHEAFWLRVRWLFLGAAVGVTLAAVYLQIFISQRFLQFSK